MSGPKLPYRRLVSWRNWEIPVPDREATLGFLCFLGISSLLHGLLLLLCWWIRR
jgi:hypothetical protein